jgi:hypothetical protein
MRELASPWYAVVPACGGAVLGLYLWWLSRRKPRALVDAIEANALHGGRMSIKDSVTVVLQNLISNGFGASVGLEAAYTQISASIALRIGIGFEMRRSDLRTLVGCGAAAGIAAAFNAPLTGAFYAFELIIGTYSIVTLAPVVAAALCLPPVGEDHGSPPRALGVDVLLCLGNGVSSAAEARYDPQIPDMTKGPKPLLRGEDSKSLTLHCPDLPIPGELRHGDSPCRSRIQK